MTPVLDRSWQQRSLGLLHTIRCDPRAQPQLSLPAFVYSQSVDAGLARWWGLAQYGHDPGPGGRAATGTHLACSFVALMWVTWRTACPGAQHSRTSGRSGALTLAWRPLMVHGGPPGSGFSTLGTWTTLPRSCGLTSDSWDSSAPVWNIRSHPAEHANVVCRRLAPAGRLPWWRLLTCEALSTWALLSRLPFYFYVFMCTWSDCFHFLVFDVTRTRCR